jgi:magnesium chelatase subunit D
VTEADPAAVWTDATLVAALLAVDPHGLGGAVVTAFAGPVRDRWLREFARLCPDSGRFLPHMDDASLLGGLDLTATLRDGVPRAQRGLLAACHERCLVIPMAERLSALQGATISAALDEGAINLQRDGFSCRWPARLGVVLLNESVDAEDACPQSLLERCGFRLDLSAISVRDLTPAAYGPEAVRAARARLPRTRVADGILGALCATAQRAGIHSLRAPLLALRAARAAAALLGEPEVGPAQARLAVRLVLAPRADSEQQNEAPSAPESGPDAGGDSQQTSPELSNHRDAEDQEGGDGAGQTLDELTEMLVAAVFGAPKLSLSAATHARAGMHSTGPAGRAGPTSLSGLRGRPHGARRGAPDGGARLDLLATLRAAAPWQRIRERAVASSALPAPVVAIRRDDLHVRRYRQRAATLTLFVVDASGSAALERLGEAKGAVELLLADCYVRRDSVALIAFRGRGAETLLPPTRSLVRAKRSLAHLMGGGATPLTAGLEAAADLAARSMRRGIVPTLVLLTDGRGNVTRRGVADRRAAEEESLAVGRRICALGVGGMLVDVSARGQAFAQQLADAAGCLYLRLPQVDARRLSRAARELTAGRAGHAA